MNAAEAAAAPSVPVAIIGMGCLFPRANSLDRFWVNIRDGVDAIRAIPASHWNPDDLFDIDPKAPDKTYARRGGFLDPVDFPALDFGIAPNNLDATDTTQLLGLVAAKAALDDAGYGSGTPDRPAKALDRDRVSVILGVTGALELVIPLGARLGHPIWRRALKDAGVAEPVASDVVQRISDSYVGWQENSFPGLLGNVAAGRIANRLDLGGTNCVVDAACASSLGAVHLAMMELESGRADVALTGGLDTFNDIFMYMCFSKTPALSPSGDARPFSLAGDGTALGEGLGVVTLKRLDDARRDGDRIYAVIRGVGSSSDGKGNAVYAPVASGQTKCLNRAYANAGISPSTVELVEAHGTGTKVGDAVELAALAGVYRAAHADGTWCALGSVKSQIGHTKAAAGSAGLIKAALALYHKVLPPTIKVDQPAEVVAPGVSPFYVNTVVRPWLARADHPRRAAVSAFGFGGSNFHAVLEEADPTPTASPWDGDHQIVAFSGASADALRFALDAWPTDLAWEAFRRRAAESRAAFRLDHPHRLAIPVDQTEGAWTKRVERARALLASGPGTSPEGVAYGTGTEPGKLAVLFPGQGSQGVGMLRPLATRFPEFQAVLDAAAPTSRPALEAAYPHPAFDDATRTVQEAALRATDRAQPALGAVSLGAWRVLESLGVRADAFAGHSFGELTALCAGKRIGEADFARLAQLRGDLMAQAGGGGSADGGRMLAVMAGADAVAATLSAEGIDLVVANRNTPTQTVVSGPTEAIARAEAAFARQAIRTKTLDVAAAFHSPSVAAAVEPLRAALAGVAITPPGVPVYGNTLAEPYPSDADATRAILAGQLAAPVQFVEQVEAMAQAGVRTFLEVGPNTHLTGMVGAILGGGPPHTAIALDASKGANPGLGDLARVVARLAALGHPVQLDAWDGGLASLPAPRKAGLTVPVTGANFAPKPVHRPPLLMPKAAPVAGQAPGAAPPSPALPPVPTRAAAPNHSTAPVRLRPSTPEHAMPQPPAPRSAPLPAGLNGHAPTVPTPSTIRPVGPPTEVAPMSATATSFLAEAIRASQANLAALQRIGELTAGLHRQFLDGQDRATQTFGHLMEQQHQLTLAALGAGLAPAPTAPTFPVAAPPPPPPAPIAAPVAARRVAPPIARPTARPVPQAMSTAPKPILPTPPAAQPTPAPSRPASMSAAVQAVLAEVVSEKTGYPADVLEPAMQLDADLGIDSIKRVEILAAIQERLPDAPVIGPEHLGTIRTLGQIADFLAGGVGSPGAIAPSSIAAPVGNPSRTDAAAVQAVLAEVVSEKTGYPADVLEPAMQLDADLGIDSIKRVEILAAIQERLPDAPVIGPEHLGTIRTLGQIADFLAGSSVEPAEPVALVGASLPFDVAPADRIQDELPVRRLVPAPLMLGDEGRSVGALPVDGDVWVVDDGSSLAQAVMARLGEQGHRVVPVGADSTLEAPNGLAGLVLFAASRWGDDTSLDAFRVLRAAAPALRRAGRYGSACVAVTRLGGAFALEPGSLPPGADAGAGGLIGLVKTAGQEWPEVHCKAIDVDPSGDETRLADAIVTEMLIRGPSEVGIGADGRKVRIALRAVKVDPSESVAPLAPHDVVVVSGGARGVTAEVAVALAGAFRSTVVLLGRTLAPEPEPDWLRTLTDEAAIRRALHAQASRDGGKVVPASLIEEARRLLANREVAANLRRIEAAGGRVLYRSVDVRDAAGVAATLGAIRREIGPIRGLVHGAGVLADRRIEDQTDEQFAGVFTTKVKGLDALLTGIGDDDLRVLVLFSSSTARFGRTGQVAYAAANEVLNKRAALEAKNRPRCRVVSVNWGPWAGGMVTPALSALFAAEGIATIPLRAGADYLVEELRATAARPVEVVILGGGGPEPDFLHDEASAPVPVAGAEPGAATAVLPVQSPLAPVFERVLDVESTPILQSHVMDGRPVLPMALMLEWLAQGAMSRNPGLHFLGIDDLRVLKGVVLRLAGPETIRVLAGRAERHEGRTAVAVELRGTLPDGRDVLHARGTVVLGDAPVGPADCPEPIAVAGLTAYPKSARAIYREILFHGAELHGIKAVEGIGAAGITASVGAAPSPSTWLRQPLRNQWLSDPLAIDSAFQLMIVWSVERLGAGSLPTFVGRYRQFARRFPREGVRVAIRVVESSPHRARADVDFLDADGQPVARIEGYECVVDASLQSAFRRNGVSQAQQVGSK